MSAILESLTNQALALTPDERAELIERLADSLPPPALHPDWDAEIARRVAELESGLVPSIPADEVMAKVRALLAGAGPDGVR